MKLNVEAGDLSAVLEQLPSMRAPTVSRLADQTYYAVETVPYWLFRWADVLDRQLYIFFVCNVEVRVRERGYSPS